MQYFKNNFKQNNEIIFISFLALLFFLFCPSLIKLKAQTIKQNFSAFPIKLAQQNEENQPTPANDSATEQKQTENNKTAASQDSATSATSGIDTCDVNLEGDLDRFAVILSLIISILAITIPWSLSGELINALKGGWDKFKGHAKGTLQKTGVQTMAKEWWYKKRGSERGKRFAARWRQTFGRGKRAEEALQKQNEDIEQLTNEMIYKQALVRYNGDVRELSRREPYVADLGKRTGGVSLAKAAEAAKMEPEVLAQLLRSEQAIELLRAKHDGDGRALSRVLEDNFPKIREHLGGVIQQLGDPLKRERALQILDEIANQTGFTRDQLITMDLRTFQEGEPMARPGQAIADMPDGPPDQQGNRQGVQTDINQARSDARETSRTGHLVFSHETMDALQRLTQAITGKAQREMQNAEIQANQLAQIIENRQRERNEAFRETSASFLTDIRSLGTAIQGEDPESLQMVAMRLNQMGIAISPNANREQIERVYNRTLEWASNYETEIQQTNNHQQASQQARTAMQNSVQSEVEGEESARIFSRITGRQLTPQQMRDVQQGRPANNPAYDNAPIHEREFAKRVINNLPI